MSINRHSKKIVNDPVYGFIDIPGDFIFDIIESRWIQRLRHIRQLGLTNYVYPGATHSRFQHSLGALHLMSQALHTLRLKGVSVTAEDEEAALAAILLHDCGHGPYSHALEFSLFQDVTHEDVSLVIMQILNREYNGRLSPAIDVFNGVHPKSFLHELIAGQTDIDRLDYLRRDSFFTGVIEGAVGSDRIIKMLNVAGERLVIEEKGIHSVEKFLIARRLMYWQVYMHKTVIAAEKMLAGIMKRARFLVQGGENLYTSPWLGFFLRNTITLNDLEGRGTYSPEEVAANFARIDDNDILFSAKMWMDHPDTVLSELCRNLVMRNLPAVELENEPFDEKRVNDLRILAGELMGLNSEMIDYFVFTGKVSNRTYAPDEPQVGILLKSGEIRNISEVSDMFDHRSLSQTTVKYFLCYPKLLRK